MSALALCIRVKSTIMIYFILHPTYFSSVESIKKIKCFTLLIRIIITQPGVFTQYKLPFDFPFSKHWCTPAIGFTICWWNRKSDTRSFQPIRSSVHGRAVNLLQLIFYRTHFLTIKDCWFNNSLPFIAQ